jgi:hypothetical protein
VDLRRKEDARKNLGALDALPLDILADVSYHLDVGR